jgi:L-ascorbate metabolism protein UlaG (beta-lactamase superfamily)|nr:hypothetical protein [Pseudomonas sp. TMW22090]
MAKAKEAEIIALGEREAQVVGGFEVTTLEVQHMPLHLIAGAQDNQAGQAAGYGM